MKLIKVFSMILSLVIYGVVAAYIADDFGAPLGWLSFFALAILSSIFWELQAVKEALQSKREKQGGL